MPKSTKFEDIDHGYEDFYEAMKDLGDDPSVTVGVHSEDASRSGDGPNNAALLQIHEFGAVIDHPGGTPYVHVGPGRVKFVSKDHPNPDGKTDPHKIRIPARPVLRGSMEDHKGEIQNFANRAIIDLMRGRSTLDRMLNALGIKAKGIVKSYFGSSELEPNAKSTIRQKESTSPLIDDGHLRRAIDYEVNAD